MFLPTFLFLIPCLILARWSSAQSSSIPTTSLSPSILVARNTASLPRNIDKADLSGAKVIPPTFSSPPTSTTKALTTIAGLSVSTAVTARPKPSNIRSCNGHPEFCQRKFSNISMVVAHNSPFVRLHNAASNQLYPVLSQLNDGVRGRELGEGMLL